MAKGEIKISQKEIDQIIKDIHSGKIHLYNLPENLYNAVGEVLSEGVSSGYGLPAGADLQTQANNTARLLKKSIYQFSAAKQFQFISDMQNFLFDNKGMIKPFNEFKKDADIIHQNYNVNWLKAEYLTSLSMSESAADWEQIEKEKDIFPYLKYETKRDARVRSAHSAMNGIVKHVDDPFWDSHYPPNGWRCRCQAVPREGGRPTDLTKKNLPKLDALFSGNAGKTKKVFNDSHPYFNTPKKFDNHKSKNFGLKLPDDVKEPKK